MFYYLLETEHGLILMAKHLGTQEERLATAEEGADYLPIHKEKRKV